MENERNEETYRQEGSQKPKLPKALGLGLVSAASALAGGLAVAWWYRKTLAKLQNPIVSQDIQKIEYTESGEEALLLGESDDIIRPGR